MRSPVVIVSAETPAVPLGVLAEAHPDLTMIGCNSYEALPGLIAETGADVVFSIKFAGGRVFPRPALVESRTVRWVSVGGSGTDHLRPWDPARVTVTNAAGVAAEMMAEYALGAMLSFSLDLRGFERNRRARVWDSAGKVEPIRGRIVLIVGLGKTGEAVAHRCKAMGLTVLGVRANPRPTPSVDEVHGIEDLAFLWGRADFVVCAVPLLDSTRGLLDSAAFEAMKRSAVLIDVSRGGVVEEKALIAALENGRIKGAALDVFATEPLPAENPLWAFDNVILTPHCSSVYEGWDSRAAHMFAENLARFRRGEPLTNVVEPLRGY